MRAGRDEKSLPGRPNPRLSYKAAVWAALEEMREREKQQPEAVHIDLEKLKTTILEKKVNLLEAEYIEYKRRMNELHQHR